ncbi:hypothetical protein AGRA3207_001261 [Actinomadura graeca]|uniref:MatE family transporter n=1 Tax=Actinomadura graeca TaxID=2750812 RepID=A0ABX8QSY3_9ACTN|nr:hypothetical protein [Actinomadura graeca]QXJ20532.1 hypothetical protein AGRA3207_001261 [Actinomadura graeca]
MDDEREGPGHEPGTTHDRDFAPVNQGSDARGRTVPGTQVPLSVPGEDPVDEEPRQEDEISGTGTPGVDVGHPDALPPDEEGVSDAERGDDSR